MPGSAYIRQWADRYNVREPRFKRPLAYCILCGLCVRYCEEIKKERCLGFVGRGVRRDVAWAPHESFVDKCQQCMECQHLRPTGVFPSNWGVANNSLGGVIP